LKPLVNLCLAGETCADRGGAGGDGGDRGKVERLGELEGSSESRWLEEGGEQWGEE